MPRYFAFPDCSYSVDICVPIVDRLWPVVQKCVNVSVCVCECFLCIQNGSQIITFDRKRVTALITTTRIGGANSQKSEPNEWITTNNDGACLSARKLERLCVKRQTIYTFPRSIPQTIIPLLYHKFLPNASFPYKCNRVPPSVFDCAFFYQERKIFSLKNRPQVSSMFLWNDTSSIPSSIYHISYIARVHTASMWTSPPFLQFLWFCFVPIVCFSLYVFASPSCSSIVHL